MDIILSTVFDNPNTPPAPEPGFFDDFNRAPGPIGYTSAERRPWTSRSFPTDSTPIPLVIADGGALKGAGGTANRTAWLVEGHSTNGILSGRIKNLGDGTGALIVRAKDADNYVLVTWRVTNTNVVYAFQKRIGGVNSQMASTGAIASATGDVVEVVVTPTEITVRVNGAVIFGGSRPAPPELAGVTTHGVLLYSSSSGAEVWDWVRWQAAS